MTVAISRASMTKRASQSFAAEEVILLDKMLSGLRGKDGDIRQLAGDPALPGLARAIQRMKKTSGL